MKQKSKNLIKHKVYANNWYFNAGIIGFLNVIFEDEVPKNNNHIEIGENYIEFDNEIFNNFGEKLEKQLFEHLFRIETYTGKLNKLVDEYQNNEITINQLKKELKKDKNFFNELGFSFNKKEKDLIPYLKEVIEKLKDSTNSQIYEDLNPETRKNLINRMLKGIISNFSVNKIDEYINKIIKADNNKIDNNKLCPICQIRKGNIILSNAISEIVGFNKDNTNWIWGFNHNKLKICELCALIYNCAVLSFVHILKKIKNDYLSYFYFINYNASILELYKNINKFKTVILQEKGELKSKPIYEIIKNIVFLIKKQQAENIKENINFIEIIENPMLGGRHLEKKISHRKRRQTKAYNIFNYNIDKNLAEFLYIYLKENSKNMPKGFYKIEEKYLNVDEELLKDTIFRKLSYSDAYKYSYIFLVSKTVENKSYTLYSSYNLYSICKYIFNYLNYMKGGQDNMEEKEKIIKKAYFNGKELREKLKAENKENQINSIAYGMLNDLKIAEKERFLDKYLRLMIAHKLEIKFGKDEMLNTDDFLQFGYSFISGLLEEKKES